MGSCGHRCRRRLSDDVGRRPVLASGLIGVLVAMLLFAGRVEHATLLLRPLSALCEAIGGMRMALQSSPLRDGAD
jgi:hypothetical protein